MKLILHDYRRCPFCIRVRILLYLKEIDYEVINEPLRDWTEWMREHVDAPRVPVLQVIKEDKEMIILESNDINLWLDTNFNNIEFTPPQDSEEYQEMLDWWSWCADIFKHQIDLYKYGENRVFDSEKHKENTQVLSEMLEKLEQTLSSSTYLLGEKLTLADISIIPFIRQIMKTRNGEFDFHPYPLIDTWAGKVLDQKWFDAIVMKK